jgi:hypothetical protein
MKVFLLVITLLQVDIVREQALIKLIGIYLQIEYKFVIQHLTTQNTSIYATGI